MKMDCNEELSNFDQILPSCDHCAEYFRFSGFRIGSSDTGKKKQKEQIPGAEDHPRESDRRISSTGQSVFRKNPPAASFRWPWTRG